MVGPGWSIHSRVRGDDTIVTTPMARPSLIFIYVGLVSVGNDTAKHAAQLDHQGTVFFGREGRPITAGG